MKRTAFLTATIILMTAATSLAQPGLRPGPGPRDPNAAPLIAALGLTEAQKAAWQQAHEAHRIATQPLMEERHQLAGQIEAALESPANDACAIGALMISSHSVHAGLKAAHDALEATLLASLDAEQRARYLATKTARGAGRPRRPGPGPGLAPGE